MGMSPYEAQMDSETPVLSTALQTHENTVAYAGPLRILGGAVHTYLQGYSLSARKSNIEE